MDPGTRVWIKDKNSGDWITGVLRSKDAATITVKDERNESRVFALDGNHENPDVQFMNTADASEIENLVNLNHLNEPSILYCLEYRFGQNLIYTFTGSFLIALNPFKQLDIYSAQVLDMYQNYGIMKSQGLAEQLRMKPLPPHVYSIADTAYRGMMYSITNEVKELTTSTLADQSVLISGESGAGKTETTKHILRYLTRTSNQVGNVSAKSKAIMDKLLQSNPILEAFGNARTLRNDNSSRFGKFMRLRFTKLGVLTSGSIKTYLLETVRLCSQGDGERNFHIFYQLFNLSVEDVQRLGIAQLSPKDFCFINQGNALQVSRIDDKANFADTRKSFKSLNFSPETESRVFDIIAAVLHLGQAAFLANDNDGCSMSTDPPVLRSLQNASSLLGLSYEDVANLLAQKTIKTGGEVFVKSRTALQAQDTRDSIAKSIYGKLFEYVLGKVNAEIKSAEHASTVAEIGVLDIFGFESFKVNSLEQLCINYANESLQQQFNEFVFVNEQKEYQAEGIEWSFISFPSNQDALELIDAKKKGIFSMIDDECMMPQGSDTKLAGRMYAALLGPQGSPNFSATNAQKVRFEFSIRHYAGVVLYAVHSFLDKNKDEIPSDASLLLSTAANPLLSSLFKGIDEGKDKSKGSKFVSVTSQFKDQLSELLGRIKDSKPHYIRCIKSNELSRPDLVNRINVAEQLRYGGVIEAVRVSRSGFPFRMGHLDFLERYKALSNPFVPPKPLNLSSPPNKRQSASKEFSSDLIRTVTDDSFPSASPSDHALSAKIQFVKKWKGNILFDDSLRKEIQLGATKVFFRRRAYDTLEGRRTRLLSFYATILQARFRLFYAKQLVRTMRGQKLLRVNRAASKIQAVTRSFKDRRNFLAFRRRIVKMQSALRGKRARDHVVQLLDAELEEAMLEMELKNEYALRLQYSMRRLLQIHRMNLFRCVVVLLVEKLRERKLKAI